MENYLILTKEKLRKSITTASESVNFYSQNRNSVKDSVKKVPETRMSRWERYSPGNVTKAGLRRRKPSAKFSILDYIQILKDYLQQFELCYRDDGYPILPPEAWIKHIPEELVLLPIHKRTKAKDKSHTALVGFEDDSLLFMHLRNFIRHLDDGLDDVIGPYRDFFAIGGFDFSPCVNRPVEEQRAFILLNQLVNSLLYFNGVKLIANFRIGGLQTLSSLYSYPLGLPYLMGMLGCGRTKGVDDSVMLLGRCYAVRPSMLLLYGKPAKGYVEILNSAGFPYKIYPDYRSMIFTGKEVR